MELFIDRGGAVRCLYDEALELSSLGELALTRASHVEPDANGAWYADLAPVAGPRLGPFSWRSQALAAEAAWLVDWLAAVPIRSATVAGAHQLQQVSG